MTKLPNPVTFGKQKSKRVVQPRDPRLKRGTPTQLLSELPRNQTKKRK